MNRVTATNSAMIGFPGLGLPTRHGIWKILISGFVLTPPSGFSLRQRMLLKMLAGFMRASPEDMSSPILQRRVVPFLSEGEGRRKIGVQIGNVIRTLRKSTRKNGQFHELLKINAGDLTAHIQTNAEGFQFVPFLVFVEDQPSIRVSGIVHLLNPQGMSIISDIDDTIKDSGVVDRRELLTNTFLREFRSVEGMADVYRQWSSQGADFHYVSSSPWQLYEPLLEMKQLSQFPAGTVHLKNFRFRDQFFQRMKLKRHGKSTTIRFLAKNLPQRRFVLIGDSGEKDPEIYLKVSQKFPDQIKAVFIRDLQTRPLSSERREQLQAGSESCLFGTFRTAEELSALAADLF